MIQTVRVLKSEQDLENALSRLGELMDQEFQPGSEEEAEFDLLKLVIDSYESKRFSSPTVTPLQAIEFRMEQQGLSRKDLEQFIGSQSKVSEVLAGKRPLSLQMIRQLHKGLGIPAKALLVSADEAEVDVTDEEILTSTTFSEALQIKSVEGTQQSAWTSSRLDAYAYEMPYELDARASHRPSAPRFSSTSASC